MIYKAGTERRRYALFGVAFGCCFPLIGTAIIILEQSLPLALSSVIAVQSQTALLWIINTAPLFLGLFAGFAGIRQDRILRVVADREEVIEERTLDLTMASQSVKELLDNMRQAVFSIGTDGLINSDYSAFTEDLFGDVEVDGVKFSDLLKLNTGTSTEVGLKMQNWLQIVLGSDELQWLMTADEPLSSIEYERPTRDGKREQRLIDLEYAPIYRSGVVDKVMVIAKDVTALRGLEQVVLRKEKQLTLLSELMNADPLMLNEFLSESRGFLLSVAAGDITSESHGGGEDETSRWLMRGIHTIKGNARMCGLHVVEEIAHASEKKLVALPTRHGLSDGIWENLVGDALAPLNEALANIKHVSGAFTAGASSPTGARAINTQQKPPALFLQLELTSARLADRILHLGDGDEDVDSAWEALHQAVGDLCTTRLTDLRPHLERMVSELNRETGKSALLELHGDEILVSYTVRSAVRDILVHSIRNALDHGVEPPAQRRAAGKPVEATIQVICRSAGDRLTVVVQDDGTGIDIDLLKRKCVERGVLPVERVATLSDEDTADLVFHPGISTHDRVTSISGRGVGMDIIRSIAEQHGGSARMRSTTGQGAELIFELPRASHSSPVHTDQRRQTRRQVYYYLLVRDENGGDYGRLLDASVGGAMISHVSKARVGQQYKIVIVPPPHVEDIEPIACHIKCCWTKEAPAGHHYISGFTFEEIPQSALADFDRIIMTFGFSGESMISTGVAPSVPTPRS